MSENTKKSKKLIAEYIGKRVTAKLDGGLFDHVPATFVFRFEDPEELAEEIIEGYSDEVGNWDGAVDDDSEWVHPTLVPVAAVSSIDEDAEDDGDEDEEPYEFAWIFLDWSTKQPPGVMVTTSDDWGTERTEKNLAALGLKVSKK